ncbi:MAG: radical SAM protein, partial [Defluviitaleaceae bacterium]|nr:radical SAM protein [Defluviitaleaceae bacterium]
FRRELCDNCGLCAVNCPYGPLSTVGREMGADEVAAEVTRDRAYYEHSGGGATLSGGEPLMQFAFSAELLKKLKEQGIHTCVETCGFAGRDKLAALLPLVDIFLFDYKATDPEAHRTLTGVSNELILDNLEFLVNSGAKVILRCPLIPGVNDSAEHLAAIAELSGKYPDLLGVEVMPYHNMGVGKAKRAGVDMPELEIGMPGEEIKGQWREKLEKYGCVKLKIN